MGGSGGSTDVVYKVPLGYRVIGIYGTILGGFLRSLGVFIAPVPEYIRT